MNMRSISPPSERYKAIKSVMDLARSKGLQGMSGECGELAVAMKHVMFDGHADVVGGLNAEFEKNGLLIGHFVVQIDDEELGCINLDERGIPVSDDDVESWGMLDPEDEDWQEQARKHGFVLDENTAYESVRLAFDDDYDVLHNMKGSGLTEKMNILRRSMLELGFSPCPSIPKKTASASLAP